MPEQSYSEHIIEPKIEVVPPKFAVEQKYKSIYTRMAMELMPSLLVNPKRGFFKYTNVEFSGNWKKHSSSDMYKLKAINTEDKIFAKIFSPRHAGYPEVAYNAMLELAELMDVLKPDGLYLPDEESKNKCGGIIFFPLCTDVEKMPAEKLPLASKLAISQVAQRRKLTPVAANELIVARDRNGVKVLIDPWEDRDDVIQENLINLKLAS